MGGKFTSYRKMAVDTVKCIISNNPQLNLKHEETQTLNFNFIGAYSAMDVQSQMKQTHTELEKQYEDHLVYLHDLPRDVARNLYQTYGTACLRVVQKGAENKLNERLHEDLPFLKSQVLYAMQSELVEKPNDVVCRRVPVAVTDIQKAKEVLPEVVEIMAKEKRWGSS